MRERLGPFLSPRAGRERAPEVWRFIAELPEEGATALDALKQYQAYSRTPGLAVVISDLLSDTDWRSGLRALALACRQEVTLLQVLAPNELEPEIDGDWTLVDQETGTALEVTITPQVLRRYQETLAAYTAEIARWCRGQGIPYVQISSATALDDIVLRLLRRAGVTA
jgi:hypothetical protein